MKYRDLTKGSISRSLLLFALPMIAGNLLQQLYNIADTLIVGRVLGKNALAAVGSSYTLMTFLTSVFLGLSMGSGALFSIYKGKGGKRKFKAGGGACFRIDSDRDSGSESAGLSVFESDTCLFAGAGGNLGRNEEVPSDYFRGVTGKLPL